MTSALVIIDIQNDYFAGGNMALDGCDAAAANAAALLAHFRDRRLPVVHVQHLMARPQANYLVPGTVGAEIHASVAPRPDEVIVIKHFPNSFRATSLLETLQAAGADHLVIAGMMTHMCIDTTTRAAFDLGFKITLAHDACATRGLTFGATTVAAAQVHAAFVAALHGVFADAQATAKILGSV
ncbi:MAG: cysteine hydrolase family protein [Rhodocyclaceae bacterium]|nr:cysteine hydrolase family protein [Rhodocyclaceae bacterium]